MPIAILGGYYFMVRLLLVLLVSQVIASCDNNGDVYQARSTPNFCAKSSTKLRLIDASIATACSSADSIVCSSRNFRPKIQAGSSKEQSCFNSAHFGSLCTSFDRLSFDTEGNRNGADAEWFKPGGTYNNEEFSCYSKSWKSDEIFAVTGEADNLASAFDQAVTKCRAQVAKHQRHGSAAK